MHWRLLNSALVPIDALPPALLFGVSVYTSFRWPLPERWLSAHYRRLQHDAETMGLACPLGWEELLQALMQITPNQAVRLTLLPQIEHFPELFTAQPSQILLSTRPLPPRPVHPLRLKTEVYESPLAGIKHGSLAEGVRLKRRALAEGFDEVLCVDRAGWIREAITANFFCIQGQTLLTPDPQETPCLPGIMRQQALEAAAAQGLKAQETRLSFANLSEADGAFLSNAVQGVIRVASVNDTLFPWSEPSQALLQRLENRIFGSA